MPARSPVLIVYSKDYDGIWSSSIPLLSFLINENILGRRFRSSLSFGNLRISPLAPKYKCPQLSLLIITQSQQTNKIEPSPILLFHANTFTANACFEHSDFLTVKSGCNRQTRMNALSVANPQKPCQAGPRSCTTTQHSQSPTTSVLTATTLVYAYRAGITAAAGTRLALCWILDKLFSLFSFQLEDP